MKTEFEVTSDEATLKLMLTKYPTLKVTERWGTGNWNVMVPNDVVQDWEEWCEDHNVENKII